MTRFLNADQYDAVAKHGLTALGLTPDQADAVLAARWPMTAEGLISEAFGRGLRITLDGIQAYLDALADWAGEDRITTDQIGFCRGAADRCLEWLIEHGHAEPTDVGRQMNEDFEPVARILRSTAAPNN